MSIFLKNIYQDMDLLLISVDSDTQERGSLILSLIR